MKYRLLTHEELTLLEDELKQFLIVNGVEGDTWLKLNQNEPEKALKLVEIFSDNVFQKVYEKTEYLERPSADECYVFHFGKEKAELIAFKKKDKNDKTFDLSSSESILDALQHHLADLDFFKSEKSYTKSREEEIHEMVQQGCLHSTKEFWYSLKSLVK